VDIHHHQILACTHLHMMDLRSTLPVHLSGCRDHSGKGLEHLEMDSPHCNTQQPEGWFKQQHCSLDQLSFWMASLLVVQNRLPNLLGTSWGAVGQQLGSSWGAVGHKLGRNCYRVREQAGNTWGTASSPSWEELGTSRTDYYAYTNDE
jgi:hypothetical protein